MAKFNLVNTLKNYYKKKSKFSLASDLVFVVFIALLIIPSTRVEVASFFIRLTSFSPSELNKEEQFTIPESTKNWNLSDMHGKTVVFGSLMEEKPVFVNFWATWCPPCVAELPGIDDLYQKYGNQVSFVLASNEPVSTVIPFAQKRGLEKLPFYQYNFVPQAFQSSSIPVTFLLDKTGKVVLLKTGAARWNSDQVSQIIDELLKE